MVQIQLSKRLSAVARYVPENSILADIGTDHALLPVYLAQHGRIQRAIAGDIHPGPVEAALRQVNNAGLQPLISVRSGDGLSVLSAGEADVIAIAGMGGTTMADILANGRTTLQGVKRLILQPNIGEWKVREWLRAFDWKLTAEELLEEDALVYEVIVADAATDRHEADRWNSELYDAPIPGIGNVSARIRMLMGPLLLREASDLFAAKWDAYIKKQLNIIARVSESDLPETVRKRDELSAELQEIKEVLACILRSKRL